MNNFFQTIDSHSHNTDNALSVISRDLLVDIIMSAGEQEDEKMSGIFINIHQQLLIEEDRVRSILNSIAVPTRILGEASQYLSDARTY